VPNARMMPAVDIQWRMAALYCNWLHNGRQSNWDSLRTGAYDTGTWGVGPNNTVTDATSHLSGARFWIPTFDEWQKAAFYDPNHSGQGQGGWRQFPNGSNSPPIGGFPGEVTPNGLATTSTGIPQQFAFNGDLLSIPLAAYGQSQSPWGLFDTSGGAAEWTEERGFPSLDGTPSRLRMAMGPTAGLSGTGVTPEMMLTLATRVMAGGGMEDVRFSNVTIGLRIAASIPSPSGVGVVVLGLVVFSRRSR
jgi:formylglycine-generating enzyme required for sulfatase activity